MGLQASVLGLQMLPVSYLLLSNRMQTLWQEPNQLLVKLHSKAGQKYFTLSGPLQSPSAVSLNLSSIIHVPGRTADVDGLMSSVQDTTQHRTFTSDSKPPLLPAGFCTSAPSSSNDGTSNMGTVNVSLAASRCLLHAPALLVLLAQPPLALDAGVPVLVWIRLACAVQDLEARVQLKAAILKSHPPTARYIVETAAVCLDYGLQTAPPQGFTLQPVAWNLVVKAVKLTCPAIQNLSDKLCGSVGQKYFGLLGTSPSGWPQLVAAKLDSLITSPNRPSVAHLLARTSSAASSRQLYQSSVPSQHASITVCTPALLPCRQILLDCYGAVNVL